MIDENLGKYNQKISRKHTCRIHANDFVVALLFIGVSFLPEDIPTVIGEGGEYSLRGFCAAGPSEDKKKEFTEDMRSFIDGGRIRFTL